MRVIITDCTATISVFDDTTSCADLRGTRRTSRDKSHQIYRNKSARGGSSRTETTKACSSETPLYRYRSRATTTDPAATKIQQSARSNQVETEWARRELPKGFGREVEESKIRYRRFLGCVQDSVEGESKWRRIGRDIETTSTRERVPHKTYIRLASYRHKTTNTILLLNALPLNTFIMEPISFTIGVAVLAGLFPPASMLSTPYPPPNPTAPTTTSSLPSSPASADGSFAGVQ